MRKAKRHFYILVLLMFLIGGCKKQSAELLTQNGGLWYVEEVLYYRDYYDQLQDRYIDQGTLKFQDNGEVTYTYADSITVSVNWEIKKGSGASEDPYDILSFLMVDTVPQYYLEIPLIKAWTYDLAAGGMNRLNYLSAVLHSDYVVLRSDNYDPSVEIKLTRQD